MKRGISIRRRKKLNMPSGDLLKRIKVNWQIYLLLVLPLTYLIIFKYIPMSGILIAFKNYNVRQGIFGSQWVGLKYFKQFFNSPYFLLTVKNTIGLSLYGLIAGFPCPIILAIALNEVSNRKFKKTVQMITYAPHFISTVIIVAILYQLFDIRTGVIIRFLGIFGVEPVNVMGEPSWFKSIYVWSDIWKSTGYGAVIYIAALASVDPALYEAAKIDGASRFQKICNIDIPCILPTIVILFIMRVGRIMNVGFEKVFLMQNDLNASSSEIIATYVYKVGLESGQFSFSTAVGLFNAIINFILLILINKFARTLNETSLW